jgi:hypothetical protein
METRVYRTGGGRMILEKLRYLCFGLAVLLLAGVSQAQMMTSDEVAEISDEEKIREAQRAQERIANTMTQMTELLETARDGDATDDQVQCVSEKLTTINGFHQVADQSAGRLSTAVERGDVENSGHHYMMVMIADQRVQTLQAQAQQCAGFALQYEGQTQRKVDIGEIAPGYDSRDFTDNLAGAFLILEEVPPPNTADR